MLAVFGANPQFVFQVMSCLASAGHDTVSVGPGRWSMTRLSRRCRGHWACPEAFTGDAIRARRALEILGRRRGVRMWVPADWPATQLLSDLAATDASAPFHFPVSAPERLARLHEKDRLAEWLLELGLPHPPTTRWHPDEAVSWAAPLVAKPRAGEGGVAVAVLRSAAEFAAHRARHPSVAAWLLQRYVPGADVDWSVVADRGQIVCGAVQRGGGGRIEFLDDPEVAELGAALVAGTGLHGVAHFDLRRGTDGRLYVIECNPRFWGSLMHAQWMGRNFPEAAVRVAEASAVKDLSPLVGVSEHIGVAPRRWLRSRLRLEAWPPELSPGGIGSWRDCHSDPLPHLYRRLADAWQARRARDDQT